MSTNMGNKIKAVCALLNADSDFIYEWEEYHWSIIRSDGAVIVFKKMSITDKLTISGLTPEMVVRNEEQVIKSIVTSSLENAADIYKDIKNRLLPDYLPEYEKQRAAVLKSKDARTKIIHLMKSIAQEFRLSYGDCCSDLYFGGEGAGRTASGKAELTGQGDITARLIGLSPEQLRDIIAIIYKS